MKTFTALVAVLVIGAGLMPAANLTQTTLASPLSVTGTTINVASATGITFAGNTAALQKLYIIDPGGHRGELVMVSGAPNGTQIPIARVDQATSAHITGAIVLIAPLDPTQGGFQATNPYGVPLSTPLTLPFVNVNTGDQFILSNKNIWIAGWNMPDTISQDSATAVASAAGLVTPTGPLFHMTGSAAVTGFNIPVGFAGGCFTVVADGGWTWTAANNIALASSGAQTVSSTVTFCYDSNTAKFYPSHQ